MAGLRVDYKVIMEDPDERHFTITVDQRDFAAFEGQDDIPDDAWHTRARFMVWNAMRRKGLTSAGFATFNTEHCVSVENAEEADASEEDEQGLDPGRTSAPAVN